VKGLVLLISMVAVPFVAAAQKQCVKGKPCGQTCIAAAKTCHVERPAYAPPSDTDSAPPGTAFAEPGGDMSWVASSRGEVYYRRGCATANRLAPENRVFFRTEEEAKRAGYRRSGSPGC
jgi:hypothetical protein